MLNKRIDTHTTIEKTSAHNLNAAGTLALGKAMLKDAFLSPIASTSEANDMITEAFKLGYLSIELERTERDAI
jgi:hypothetical protein